MSGQPRQIPTRQSEHATTEQGFWSKSFLLPVLTVKHLIQKENVDGTACAVTLNEPHGPASAGGRHMSAATATVRDSSR